MASEYGETWQIFNYTCEEINSNTDNKQLEDAILIKEIDIKNIPSSLKQSFINKLQQHLNNVFSHFVPKNFDKTAYKVRNNIIFSDVNLSKLYTLGAVQGFFVKLNLMKDPALGVSHYLTLKEGKALTRISKH